MPAAQTGGSGPPGPPAQPLTTGLTVTVNSQEYQVVTPGTEVQFPSVRLLGYGVTAAMVAADHVEATNGVHGSAKASDGVLGQCQSNQHAGVSGINNSGGAGVYGSAKAWDGVRGDSQSNQHAGVSGINNSGGPGVYGSANAWDGVHGESQSSQHAGVSGINSGGGFGVWAAGTPAGHFEGDVEVTGILTARVDVVLGSDCAEDFDIAPSAEIEPGMVMVLTDNGALQPSQSAYDRKVAGVISGAGDYQPGLILGRSASSQKRMPLALVGKVHCRVDAGNSPVEIGDLLTTSPTPGHAMKAVDPSRAFGSVIGKALGELPSGRGLIPILIALQ